MLSPEISVLNPLSATDGNKTRHQEGENQKYIFPSPIPLVCPQYGTAKQSEQIKSLQRILALLSLLDLQNQGGWNVKVQEMNLSFIPSTEIWKPLVFTSRTGRSVHGFNSLVFGYLLDREDSYSVGYLWSLCLDGKKQSTHLQKMPTVPYSFLCTHHHTSSFLKNQASNTSQKGPRKKQNLHLVTHICLSLYPS